MSNTATTASHILRTRVIRTGEWVVSGYYMNAGQAQRDADTIFARRESRIEAIQA